MTDGQTDEHNPSVWRSDKTFFHLEGLRSLMELDIDKCCIFPALCSGNPSACNVNVDVTVVDLDVCRLYVRYGISDILSQSETTCC